jgi:hypothetical protein
MNVKVRLGRSLLEDVRADLSRPHPFAAERIGFLYGRLVEAGGPLVLLTGYEPVDDAHYVNDPFSGARIDSRAIRGAMQGVLDRGQGAFHVHLHHRHGRPVMSLMDAEEIPGVVTGLRRAGPAHASGIILLHDVECAAWVWLPGEENAVEAESVSVVGFPFRIFRRPAS